MCATHTVFSRISTTVLLALTLTLPAVSAHAADASLEQQLQEHADRIAINAVLIQYTTGLDLVDADIYAGAFTSDAIFRQGANTEAATVSAEGTDQIRKIITDLAVTDAEGKARREAEWEGEGSAPTRLRHHVMTNSVVEFIDANTATHRAYWMTVGGSGRDMAVLAMGSYQDTLVKRDGKWLIHERNLLAR